MKQRRNWVLSHQWVEQAPEIFQLRGSVVIGSSPDGAGRSSYRPLLEPIPAMKPVDQLLLLGQRELLPVQNPDVVAKHLIRLVVIAAVWADLVGELVVLRGNPAGLFQVATLQRRKKKFILKIKVVLTVSTSEHD